MTSIPYILTPELWTHIFSYCVDSPSSHVVRRQVARPTLVNLLQVNSTFFSLAAPLLYRDVVIENLGGILLGLNQPKEPSRPPAQDWRNVSDLEMIQRRQSKLALFRYIRRLTIIPYTLPESIIFEESTGSGISSYATILEDQQSSYSQAKSILRHHADPTHTVGGLTIKSITIGRPDNSHLGGESKENDRIISRFFSEIHGIRRSLLDLFRPEVWCEYSALHGYCFEPLLRDFQLKRGKGRDEDGDENNPSFFESVEGGELPKVVNIHTNLEGTFPLVWGTTNRISIQPKRKNFDPGANTNTSTSETNTPAVALHPLINAGTNPEEIDMIPIPRLTQEELVRRIVYTIVRSTPPWLRRLSEEVQGYIDGKTVIEIYGLELVIIAPPEGRVLPQSFAGKTEDSPNDILKKLEDQVREESGISDKRKWNKTGKKAPSIGLFLATEYPGCEACGTS